MEAFKTTETLWRDRGDRPANEMTRLRTENALLRRELDQSRTLARVSVEQPHTHELAKLVAQHAAECLQTRQAWVGLVIEDAIRVEVVFSDGALETPDFTIPPGENAAGWVVNKRHPAIIADARTDTLISPEFRQHFGCRSILCAPMLDHQNQVLGVIQWHDRCDGKPFEESDLVLAQSVAMQAAVAFQRSLFYDKVQQWVSSLESLFAFNSVINENINPATLIQQLVEHAVGFLGADGGLGGLAADARVMANGYLQHGTWHPLSKEWRMHVGVPGWVVGNGCPYLANEYPNDLQAERDWIERFDVRHALCVPIVDAKNQPLGFFEVHKGRGRLPFTWQDASFLESLANITAIAISNAGLVKDLAEHRQQIAALSAQHVNWIEDERRRLARELHDETGQALIGIKLSLRVLVKRIPAEHADLRDEVDHLREQVNDATVRLKSIAQMLRPPTLDELGLDAALRQLASDFQQRADIQIHLQSRMTQRPPQAIETACYRIAQEALTNVARHAQATHVWIELSSDDNKIMLKIRDDGVGFDTTALASPHSLGLLGMQERATMFGGTLNIVSVPNSGTSATAMIPFEPG